MQPMVRAYIKISGVCLGLTLALQSLMLKELYDAGLKNLLPSVALTILTGTGIYFLLYKCGVTVFERWAWRWLFPRLCIDGTWYHCIESEGNAEYKRYGRTQIRQEVFDLQINGMNPGRTHLNSLGRAFRAY